MGNVSCCVISALRDQYCQSWASGWCSFLPSDLGEYVNSCWVSFGCLREDFKMLLNEFCILSVHKRRLLMETGWFMVTWCESEEVLLLTGMSWSHVFKTFREPWILENYSVFFCYWCYSLSHLSLNSNSTWLDQQVFFLIFLKEKKKYFPAVVFPDKSYGSGNALTPLQKGILGNRN